MGKGIEIDFRADHVHVQLGPDYEFDPSGRDEIWARIKALCEEHKTCRVLVEGFVPPGERETADVIAAGQRTATIPRLWMALRLENFVPNEQSELFEAIAASKGVRVKFFQDTDRALTWLRHNSPQ